MVSLVIPSSSFFGGNSKGKPYFCFVFEVPPDPSLGQGRRSESSAWLDPTLFYKSFHQSPAKEWKPDTWPGWITLILSAIAVSDISWGKPRTIGGCWYVYWIYEPKFGVRVCQRKGVCKEAIHLVNFNKTWVRFIVHHHWQFDQYLHCIKNLLA